jgi:hypothetical protein
MGRELVVEDALPLGAALERLAGAGCQLAMVDGQLVHPSAPPPDTWREVRLRTPAGMLTVRRQDAGVAVTVFGNAGPELVAMQERVAEAWRTSTT